MSIRELEINLDHSPSKRWSGLVEFRTTARMMMQAYVRDLGGLGSFGPVLREYSSEFIPPDQFAEMKGIASVLDAPLEEVVLANLYYDVMAFLLGCTAFAVDAETGPIHGRNLDWWSFDDMLSTETTIYRFSRGRKTRFITVSWPGFNCALSGLAPERFSITLNAVLSEEPSQPALPVTSLIRSVLEEVPSYEEAVRILTRTPIVCSALLLVAGAKRGELCVIERTPTQGMVREPSEGIVLATNDYQRIEPHQPVEAQNEIHETSCARYARASELLRSSRPNDPEAALQILKDPGVRMGITAQHMVFHPRSAGFRVELPTPGPAASHSSE